MKNMSKCYAEPLLPRLRDQGRLFACHSERSEESLSFRGQGRFREASRAGLKSTRVILRFAQNDNLRLFFSNLLRKLKHKLPRHRVIAAARNQIPEGYFGDSSKWCGFGCAAARWLARSSASSLSSWSSVAGSSPSFKS